MISCMMHVILIFILYNFHPNDMRIGTSQVYEVTIVTNAPLHGTVESKSDYQNNKFVHASLDAVEIEQPLQDNNSAIDDQSRSNAGNSPQFIGQTGGASYIPEGGDPYEIALWKTRARGMVETLWKSLPEDTKLKTSLQTTYLLMVSRTGEVLDKELLVSSGNETFDQSVLLALSKISRLPPPPLVLIAGDESFVVPMSFASAK